MTVRDGYIAVIMSCHDFMHRTDDQSLNYDICLCCYSVYKPTVSLLNPSTYNLLDLHFIL
jgi:hypothetical protein